jgi:hypothetical protein
MHNAKEIKVTPVFDKVQEYKRNWFQHVKILFRNRLPRIIKKYIDQNAEETRGDG